MLDMTTIAYWVWSLTGFQFGLWYWRGYEHEDQMGNKALDLLDELMSKFVRDGKINVWTSEQRRLYEATVREINRLS